MQRIGTTEARRHLPHLLDRVAHGESLTITRHGKSVAQLVPVPAVRILGRFVEPHGLVSRPLMRLQFANRPSNH